MCCIHLFTWHTMVSPSFNSHVPFVPRQNLLVHEGESCMCNKSCHESCQKNLYRVLERTKKLCNDINTENLCFQKYNFSYFFLGCQEEYHVYDMPCCVHFTGYNQQLRLLMHYSFHHSKNKNKKKVEK